VPLYAVNLIIPSRQTTHKLYSLGVNDASPVGLFPSERLAGCKLWLADAVSFKLVALGSRCKLVLN
jgi:hypothetical protein